MALAGALEIQLSADVARLKKDMQDVKSIVGGTAKDLEGAFSKLNSVIGALGVSLGAAALLAMGKAAVDAADHMNDLTKSTGLAVEELAGLNVAAKMSGTTLDGVASAVQKLSQNMGKNAEQFKALGITARDPLEAFKQAADMFAALGTEQEKAAFGVMAFGKSWADIAPLLAEGGKKIGEMTKQGKELSGMTKELAEQSDALNDKLVILTGTGGGMNAVLNALLPLANKLADDLTALKAQTEGSAGGFNILLETFKVLVVVGGNVAFVFKTIADDVAATGRQVIAFGKGEFREVFRIREASIEAAKQGRKDFDAWEKSIMAVGTAASVAASKLDAMDQVSRRVASEGAAQARKDAEEAGKRLKDAQNLEEAKRNAAAAEKARLAEEKRLQELGLKGWIDFAKNWEQSDFEATKAIAEGHIKLNEENQKLLDKGTQDQIQAGVNNAEAAEQEAKIITDHKREQNKQQIADAEEAARKQAEAYAKVWQQVDDFAFSAFESMFKKGEDTWKQLAESLKHTMIRALYELTVQKWTLQLFAQVAGSPAGQAMAGGPGSSLLNTAGSVVSGAQSAYTAAAGFFAPTAAASAGGAIAGTGAVLTPAALGVAAEVAGTSATVAGMAAAVVPVVGWIVAAAALVYALYSASKEPAQVRGGLGFGGPFEDQTAGTKTPFGTIGFSDAMTQQFSGQVGKAFSDAIGALLTAGAAQLTPEAVDDVTRQMHDTILLSAEGTFTTEEFLSRFGPDMARQLLDPMLAAVDPYAQKLVDSFEGPLQELLNLAADVLAVTGALSDRGEEFTAIFGQAIDLQALEAMRGEGESFTATLNRLAVEFQATNAIALLFGKTQEETWGAVGLASEEARAQLIKFAGGADALNASLASYYEHYFTAEEKHTMQQDALAESFAALGVEMPTTIQGFRDLVEAQKVNTEAGAKTYTGLMKLEGGFYSFITAIEKTDTALRNLIDVYGRGPAGGAGGNAGAYFGVQMPTQAEAGKGGGRFEVKPEVVPLQQEIDLREKLRQLKMSENEVLARQRVLTIERIEKDKTLTAAQKETLIGLQKQIDAQEDLNKAAAEAAKAIEDMANAAGLSKGSLSKVISEGLKGTGDESLGKMLGDTLTKGIETALRDQAAEQIAKIFYDGLVLPIIDQIIKGKAVAEVINAGSLAAMVESAKKIAAGLKEAFDNPEFKAAMEAIKKALTGLGGATAGVSTAVAQAEWQFFSMLPSDPRVLTTYGGQSGAWVNQQGTYSSFPGLSSEQGGAGSIEDQRLAMLAQIYDLLGDKVNALVVLEIQRSLALQKLAPELRGLQTQLWGLQDAAEAAAKALEFLNAKRALEIQLARAQGNESLAVEMEHAAIIEELNRQWGAGSQQATELIALYQQLWSITGDVAVATDGWIKSLQDWLRALTLDETLSPLTAQQRFNYAQQQYVETLMGAQGGDADARQRFTETADSYLRESLNMFGRASTDYNAIYQAIVAQTEGLIAQGLGPAAPVTMADVNSTLLAGQATAREQMTTLLAKVDNLVDATTDSGATVATAIANQPLSTARLA